MRLAESQHRREGFVDAPLLLGGELADQVAKPSGVDGSDLFNQDADSLAEQFDFRAKRCCPGTERCWRDQHHRTR